MIIKVYTNDYKDGVWSEKDYQTALEEKKRKMQNDANKFYDWLDENYCISDIWTMSEDNRRDAKQDYISEVEEEAIAEMSDEFTEWEIDI